jgi:DNA-binding NarL/FixJ family response regulator
MGHEGGPGRAIVLLVDDSPETLGVLIDALEGAGITALVARDGGAALALLERITPDLILLDAVMPGIDGFAACRAMKARPELETTPVVFMTGLSDAAHVVEGLRAGGVDYVAKPIRPDEMIARIAVHIANARLVADARRALDAADRAVLALRPDGRIAWASPRAAGLLAAELGPAAGRDAPLGPGAASWAAEAAARPVSLQGPLALEGPAGGGLRLTLIGRSASGDALARVAAAATEPPGARLSRALGISLREGEVLGWLAQGKSNRDIADILGLSHRTVTKHVEQIFTKLGVENRTSAAAIGLRHVDL